MDSMRKVTIGLFSIFLMMSLATAEVEEPVPVNDFELGLDEGSIILDEEDVEFDDITLIEGEEEVTLGLEGVASTDQGIEYNIIYDEYEPNEGNVLETDSVSSDETSYNLESVQTEVEEIGDEVLEFDVVKEKEGEITGTLVTDKDFNEREYFEAEVLVNGEPQSVILEAFEFADEYNDEYEEEIVRYEMFDLEVNEGDEIELIELIGADESHNPLGDTVTIVEDIRFDVLEFESSINPDTGETDITVVFEKDFDQFELSDAEIMVNDEPQSVILEAFDYAEEYDDEYEGEIVRYEMFDVEGQVGDEIEINTVIGEDYEESDSFERGVIDGFSTLEDNRIEVLEIDEDTIVFNKDFDQKEAFEIEVQSDGETHSRQVEAFEEAEEYDDEYEEQIVRYEIIDLEDVVSEEFEVTEVTVEDFDSGSEEVRGLKGETIEELISIINEYSSSEELSDIIRISNNIEVIDDKMVLEDNSNIGSMTIDTQSTEIELDVTIEGDSVITSDDLFEDENLEEEMVLTESGTYLLESPRTSATIDMERNSDVTVNSVSEIGEEQDTEIPTVVIGQNLVGDLSVEGETEQDYYYQDGFVTYLHATEYIVEISGEEEEVISQGEWTDIGTVEDEPEEADVISDYSYTADFDETFHSTGEYAFVVTVVESNNIADEEEFLEEWTGWEHEEIDRQVFEFSVVEPEEPVSPIESLGTFFNSIVDSIVDNLTGVFDSGELQMPSLQNPPSVE